MAEHDKDPRITQHYRNLGREEPPRPLDDAILAASRRDLRRRPWLYPVAAAAAVGVLGVALTVQMERQPEIVEAPAAPQVAQAPAVPAAKEEPAPKAEARVQSAPARSAPAKAFVPDPKPSADASVAGTAAGRRDD